MFNEVHVYYIWKLIIAEHPCGQQSPILIANGNLINARKFGFDVMVHLYVCMYVETLEVGVNK